MITRIVKMTIRCNEQKQFAELFETHRPLISAMPGCEALQLLQDSETSGIFFTISIWESTAHLDEYRNSAVFKALWPRVKSLFHSPAEAWSLNEMVLSTNSNQPI